VDNDGVNINTFVDSWDDGSGPISGTILVRDILTPTIYAEYDVTGAVISASTYSKVAVTHVVSSGTFVDGKTMDVRFIRSGLIGSGGPPGPAGPLSNVVEDGSPQLGGFLDANGHYIQMQKGGDISSASPLVIDTDGDYFVVSGTTNFSEMTVAADRHFFLEFAAILTITHGGGTIDIPGAANYTSVASDVIECVSTAANDVTIVGMELVSGKAQVESVTLANSVTLTNKTLTAPAVTLLTGTFNSPTGTIGAHTLGGAVTGGDQTVSSVNLKDWGEITVAHGDTSGADIACSLVDGNVHSMTISTNEVTLTFTNVVASDEAQVLTLIIVNAASQTLNFPTSVDWRGGSAPTLTASGTDILTFITIDGGTIWHGIDSSLDSK